MRRPRPAVLSLRVAAVPATAALLLGLGACGGGGGSFADQSAKDIVAAAKKDTTGASSVRLQGSYTQKGKPVRIDLQLDDQGDCTGSISLDGGTAEILGTGGKYWFKPDDAFWESQAGAQASQIIAAVGDKYVENDEFKSACDLTSLFAGDKNEDKTPTKGDTSTIDGQQVIEVDTTDDQGNPSHAYVLTSSPHYVVKLVGDGDSSGDDKGEFTLSDFGKKLDVQAPAASDVADLSSLGG